MTITFWITLCVLIAIAFFIIIPPLWRIREVKETDSEQRNIKIAQDKSRDLKQQLESGLISQKQFDEQYSELALTLNDDLDDEQPLLKNSSQGRGVIPFILVFFPLLSVLIYFLLGEPNALLKAESQTVAHASKTADLNVNAMVSGLAERLRQDPENAEGWLMLGRSYKYLKQFRLAANAFENAYRLMGEQPEVMLQYADSLVMLKGGNFSGKAADLVFKALEKSPNNVTALWLAGMAKAENKDFSQALAYWHKLETILSPDSDSYQELQALIASVSTQSTGMKAAKKSTASPKIQTAVSIRVKVSIAKTIKTKISQHDTVFIYAKALAGAPMPLAIVRKQVADLPLSITLDDSMAMIPEMKLSNFEQVKIIARISKSGTAIPQKGDFMGVVELQKLNKETSVIIIINEEI